MIEKLNPFMIFESLTWLRTFTLWLIPSTAGWSTTLLFQTTPSHWYQQPAVIAGFVSGLVAIVVIFVNRHFQKSDKKRDEETAKSNQNMTFTERMQELAQEREQTVYTELKSLHEKEMKVLEEKAESEIKFWKREFNIKSRSEFEARKRAHRFGNEVNRLTLYVLVLHAAMSKANLEFPEFELKSYDQLMAGLDEEVQQYQNLSERYDELQGEQ